MRINRYVAQATGLGRRKVDQLIIEKRIKVDDQAAKTGQNIQEDQIVTLDNKVLSLNITSTLIMLNKPTGYVVSKNGQGAKTVYDLLPKEFNLLKPIGRLDKDSRGLLLLSNDGLLIQKLSHPSNNKTKIYEIRLNKPLSVTHKDQIEKGVMLKDGLSKLILSSANTPYITVKMTEGRNRQIRRTFNKLGYSVSDLNRISFGDYDLRDLKIGKYKEVNP